MKSFFVGLILWVVATAFLVTNQMTPLYFLCCAGIGCLAAEFGDE